VLRAPAAGVFQAKVDIGDIVDGGQLIGIIAGQEVRAPYKGLVRGLLYTGLSVEAGSKIGDIDPRLDSRLCSLVSEKALAIAGGVLEAILSYPPLRPHLFV
jgi:xanthine dehydrogenase accessory factor